MMKATLGVENWQKAFDVIVMGARKPLFMRSQGNFFEFDSYKENNKGPKIADVKSLKNASKANYVLEGNMETLTKLFHSMTKNL